MPIYDASIPLFQVFGDRTLAEHEVVGELIGQLAGADSAPSPYRHIFVRLRDIEAVSMTTCNQRTLSFDLSGNEGEISSRLVSGHAQSAHVRSSHSALTTLIGSQAEKYAQALS